MEKKLLFKRVSEFWRIRGGAFAPSHPSEDPAHQLMQSLPTGWGILEITANKTRANHKRNNAKSKAHCASTPGIRRSLWTARVFPEADIG
jgi:hypothetical protein